jgi:hypothetical protein
MTDRKENISDDDYLYGPFIKEIIKEFKTGGYAEIKDNVVRGGFFLFGYRGKLYEVESDFQIGKYVKNYCAVGCGSDYALGCLHGLENSKLLPKEKVTRALEAAEEFSAGVRRPFNIVSVA